MLLVRESHLWCMRIVPNARAGFLKATYTQWCVADFRPERTPFKNLCTAIGAQLQIADEGIVESQLSHGFSSLIEFYKNSIRYNDTHSNEWINANDEEKAALKRRAANLIIIADQFEEFFTNPENYRNGKPSKESNLVVNILLETARIALEENLPIYVIFTMRSDYIGQCAAFRGLPESIGFSQFFVPRLNRNELLDVVEEPAVLSGNRISRRLTDRLVHDIVEGIDQLPLLQHTLNQIWVAANDGKDEMDLLHYAMVGGLSVDELPDEDKITFNKWFNDLPKNIQACFNKPKLQNVLDSHANKLLETAGDYFKEKYGETISDEVKNTIVKTTFTCLTKIDQSRAVRNRMTLREIHKIIDSPDITLNMVKGVLNLFREPGNTLVRPFITEDVDSSKLTEDDILDITHESLIRNWELLKEWANEEFEHLTTFQDFYQQVSRWKKNDKSSGFLLPIGTLIHFEDWANNLSPNPYWINRYLKTGEEEKTLPHAKEILEECTDYLNRSSKKHAISRWVMKVGMGKIAAALSILVILLLTSFVLAEKYQRTNEVVLNRIQEDALLSFNNSQQEIKNSFLIETAKENFRNIDPYIKITDGDDGKLSLLSVTGGHLIQNDYANHWDLKEKFLNEATTFVKNILPNTDSKINNQSLKALSNYMVFLEEYSYFKEDSSSVASRITANKVLNELIFSIIEGRQYNKVDVRFFNKCLELGLNSKAFNQDELNVIIRKISPLNPNSDSLLLNEMYDKEKTYITGKEEDAVNYNGLYQLMAEYYAALGDVENTIICVDKLYQDNTEYEEYRPNAITFAAYFLLYNHKDEFSTYIKYLSEKYSTTNIEIFKMLSERVGISTDSRWNNLNDDYWENPILFTLPYKHIKEILAHYLSEINNLPNGDSKYYETATFFKLKGTKLSIYAGGISNKYDEEIIASYESFINYYDKINTDYLNTAVNSFIEYENIEPIKRKNIINFPDYRDQYFIDGKSGRVIRYKSTSFIDYILRNGHFEKIYKDEESLSLIQYWIQNYLRNDIYYIVKSPKISTLEELEKKLRFWEKEKNLNLNALRLAISEQNFEISDYEKSIPYLERMDPSTFSNMYIVLTGPDNESLFAAISEAYISAVLTNNFALGKNIMNGISQLQNKVVLYAAGSYQLYLNGKPELSKTYLDSAELIMKDVPFFSSGWQDVRKHYLYALHLNYGEDAEEKITPILKGSDDLIKSIMKMLFARSSSYKGNLYQAVNYISPLNSSSFRLGFYREIVRFYNYKLNGFDSTWNTYYKNSAWPLETYGFRKL